MLGIDHQLELYCDQKGIRFLSELDLAAARDCGPRGKLIRSFPKSARVK